MSGYSTPTHLAVFLLWNTHIKESEKSISEGQTLTPQEKYLESGFERANQFFQGNAWHEQEKVLNFV